MDFRKIMHLFNTLPPSIEPTASGHILEQIELIKDLIKNNYAYEINGSVYFDVKRFNKDVPYGKLSGRNIDELIHNSRALDGQSDKKIPKILHCGKKLNQYIL